jgi:peptide/nickel transport system permease protein
VIAYLLKRLGLVIPIALAVSAVCFSLVYLAPGDPLSAIVPSDASRELIEQRRSTLDKPTCSTRSGSAARPGPRH